MDKKNNNFSLTWLPKKTFEILATVPWQEVESAKKIALSKAKENLEIKGFRKGKAPDDLVTADIGQNKTLELTLEKLISQLYPEAVSCLGLKPIVSPKIELVSAKEGEDWQIKFIACEEPEVKLDSYKEEIKKLMSASSIWTPKSGIDPTKKEKPFEEDKKKEQKLEKITSWLVENIKPEIGDLLIDSEVNRKLVELLEEIKKLGLTVDQYLSSTGKTVESLRQEFKLQSERTIRLQLILNSIAESEKIEVKSEEIEKVVSSAKNEEEKKALDSQRYLLASILRQQKTLDFLAGL